MGVKHLLSASAYYFKELKEGEVMRAYYCPACGSNNIVMTDDFERDLMILKCCDCGDMFAISNADAYINGESWVFSEWAYSLVSQKRLCGKEVKR